MKINGKETELFDNDEQANLLTMYYYTIKSKYINRPFKLLPEEICEEIKAIYKIEMTIEEAETLIEYAEEIYPEEVLIRIAQEPNTEI